MRVRYTIGDWSGEGHSVSKTFYADLFGFDDISEVLNAYRKTADEVGFDISDIACDYLGSISETQAETLLDLEFRGRFKSDSPQDYLDDYINHITYNVDFGFLAIFEVMVRHNLPSFRAVMVRSEFPILYGNNNALIRESDGCEGGFFGYGYLSN